MGAALVCVGASAVCSGTATVLQAVAARRVPVGAGWGASLVWRLARSGTYLGSLLLVAAGFVLSFVALRTLPLFVVQAGRASSLAVSAVLAAVVLGARLRWLELVALAGIGAGLVMIAVSVTPQPAVAAGSTTRAVMLAVVVGIVVVAALALRVLPTVRGGLVLASLAGAAFGVLAVGARTVRGFTPGVLVGDPVAWTMAVGGALGLVLGALALQRAPVVAVTALMVGVETCLGAGLGMVLAGDRPQAGAAGSTAVAFGLVLIGALVVARFGSPDGATAGSTRATPTMPEIVGAPAQPDAR